MLKSYQSKCKSITLMLEKVNLYGLIDMPNECQGLVVFVHGSGSSRFSSRNQYVANVLSEKNIATLLFDLLTEEEEKVDLYTRKFRFDIPLLTSRLDEVTRWIEVQEKFKHLNIGYFGSSTGAAAALISASHNPNIIKAVVSRGGRPDLAKESLEDVKAPTLLLVGGLDRQVIELNRLSQERLHNINEIDIIEGATHLFEEPGKLEIVANKAANWFEKYLLRQTK